MAWRGSGVRVPSAPPTMADRRLAAWPPEGRKNEERSPSRVTREGLRVVLGREPTPSGSRSGVQGAHGDGELASGPACLEMAHGIRRIGEGEGPLEAGSHLAGLDEAGEPLEVAAALL